MVSVYSMYGKTGKALIPVPLTCCQGSRVSSSHSYQEEDQLPSGCGEVSILAKPISVSSKTPTTEALVSPIGVSTTCRPSSGRRKPLLSERTGVVLQVVEPKARDL